MSFFDLENLCVNVAFGTLFATLLVVWGQFIFNIPGRWPSWLGTGGCALANVALVCFLGLRWEDSQHFPLSNLYESLIFLAWSLISSQFVLRGDKRLLSAITVPSALFVTAFASLTLPDDFKSASALVPALQSNWLMMHVTLMILSYSFLLLGSLVAMCFLVLSTAPTPQPEGMKSGEPPTNLLGVLDNISYRTLGFGFPLLTIGILSGAIWANQAWGSYWSWDPKETWAFITWCVFAIYFHLRLNKAWTGTKPALVATCGFFLLWICYLGVNLLGQGLHSYGWFQ